MKYIDADKLIAEIVELRKELPNTIEHLNDEERGFARGQQYELTAIESEILCLQQEQPSEDLEKTADSFTNEDLANKIEELHKQFPEVSFAKLSRICVRLVRWQKEQMMKDAVPFYAIFKAVPPTADRENTMVIIVKDE